VPTVLKYGSFKHLETSGPVKACNGIALCIYIPLLVLGTVCVKVYTVMVEANFKIEWGIKPQTWSWGIALLLYDLSTGCGCLVDVTPQRFTPGKYTRFPLYRNLRGLQIRFLQVRKFSPHRNSIHVPISPVANRYTVGANPTPVYKLYSIQMVCVVTTN
jgi:hypothetical protein